VISSKVLIALFLVPGVAGLNLRIAMTLDVAVEVDLVFAGEGDISFLEAIVTAYDDARLGVAGSYFAIVAYGVDILDGYSVHLFDGILYLYLVGAYVNDKTVAVQLFALSRHFLGYYRLD